MLQLVRWGLASYAMLGAIFGAAFSVQAQNYPDRPIRLIVAFVPGGATDTLARQLSNDLGDALGQPIVIENKPGANGYIAWNFVASSDPDGYTLLLAENALGISQALYKKTQSTFDPVKQYDAIAGLASSPSVLVVSNNVPVNNVAELVALAKSTPQKMNFASAGIGSVAHLSFEVFRVGAGFDAVHVPYKGGGQAINDVIAGHVPMAMTSIQVARGLVEGGRIKGLAVTSKKRAAVLPNVPTLPEAGVKTDDVALGFWFGIFGPAGIPEPVKAKLDKAVQTVLNNPAVRERLAKLAIEPEYLPAPALKTKLQNEIVNWTKFIDTHHIKAE
jgi:tripartite-type tricarboxylate transporter receptor subunit TctC